MRGGDREVIGERKRESENKRMRGGEREIAREREREREKMKQRERTSKR